MKLPKKLVLPKLVWPPADEDGQTPTPEAGLAFKGAASATARKAREHKPESWKLDGVRGHVTFAGERMIAWYLADPQTWSFRSVAEGEELILEAARVLADLVGTTVYGRVTSRPYPVHHWAQRAWTNAPEPQEGFDAMMERDQIHMARHSQADKLVYYGIDLGVRSTAVKLLAKALDGAVDREMAALQERLDRVDALMRAEGMSAKPATGHDMEWLLARSFALGCPVPVPDTNEPERHHLTADDLQEWASTSDWSAEPLAPAVKVTTSVGRRQVTRYTTVLTFSRMADIAIPEQAQPWMAQADALGIPYEMAWRVIPRTPEEVKREMDRVALLVDGQVNHWTVEHGKRPPKQLARQAARAADVEDEMRSSFTGLSTRTKGWYRIAVSGATEREALDRAAAVIEHYGPQIKLVRELGQYALAREFVPGEPLASTAHMRHFPVIKVAAGMPTITSEVGDRRGFHIGETGGVVGRAVCFDPWYMPEVMESSGLVPFCGTQGSGKSTLMGLLMYKSILSGVRGVGMDPAGRMHRVLQLPEMRGIARSVNLLGSEPGTLSPYGVVPQPNPSLVRLEVEDGGPSFKEKMAMAYAAAEATRRDLAVMTIRWCIPYEMGVNDTVRERIRDAVSACSAHPASTLFTVMEALEGGDHVSQRIAREMRMSSERELGRLFFAPTSNDVAPRADSVRFTLFNLRGMVMPGKETDPKDWSPDELLTRPIMTLAAWASLQLIYRRDPHERKLFILDEAQEVVDQSSAGRALVYKLSSDSRKNNNAAFVASQNPSVVLGQDVGNFVGAAFVGRTQDEKAQADALRLLGKPTGQGYEEILGRLSPKPRAGGLDLGHRDFIFSDGLGGDSGRGGMERIQVNLKHHPDLFEALNTTADPRKRAQILRDGENAAHHGPRALDLDNPDRPVYSDLLDPDDEDLAHIDTPTRDRIEVA